MLVTDLQLRPKEEEKLKLCQLSALPKCVNDSSEFKVKKACSAVTYLKATYKLKFKMSYKSL